MTDDATPLDRRLHAGEPMERLATSIYDLITRIRQIEGYEQTRESNK